MSTKIIFYITLGSLYYVKCSIEGKEDSNFNLSYDNKELPKVPSKKNIFGFFQRNKKEKKTIEDCQNISTGYKKNDSKLETKTSLNYGLKIGINNNHEDKKNINTQNLLINENKNNLSFAENIILKKEVIFSKKNNENSFKQKIISLEKKFNLISNIFNDKNDKNINNEKNEKKLYGSNIMIFDNKYNYKLPNALSNPNVVNKELDQVTSYGNILQNLENEFDIKSIVTKEKHKKNENSNKEPSKNLVSEHDIKLSNLAQKNSENFITSSTKQNKKIAIVNVKEKTSIINFKNQDKIKVILKEQCNSTSYIEDAFLNEKESKNINLLLKEEYEELNILFDSFK